MLLLIGLAGVLLRFVADDERPRLPEPLTDPAGPAGPGPGGRRRHRATAPAPASARAISSTARMHVVYVIVVPLLAVNVLRDTRALRCFAVGVAALAAIKGPIGALRRRCGGVGSTVEEETISFLNPVPNLMMLALDARRGRGAGAQGQAAGSGCSRRRRSRLLSLILSYRRSFWIAAAFTLVVVVIIASRRRGRAVLAVGGVALALTLVAATTIGSSDDPSASPLAERAQTLSPGGLGTNRGDRYRMDERHNVIENIEAHPLTGIGLGVDWKVHQPLAEAHDRRYVHVADALVLARAGPARR